MRPLELARGNARERKKMLQILKTQFVGLSPCFYWILFFSSALTLILSYWGGSQGLGLFVAMLGILYAFFAGAGKLICFVFGILYSFLYLYLAFEVKLYGDVMLNLFYLPINVLGIVMWRKNQNTQKNKVIVRSLSPRKFSLCLFGVFLLSFYYGMFLDSIEGNLAYLNALSVVLQLVAFYLQVKRYVQNYALVTLANLISIFVWWMIYLQDPKAMPQLLNTCVFLGIGIYYWREWAKEALGETKLQKEFNKQEGLE